MAKKIRVWDGSAWQDVAPALPYTAVHSAQASMPLTAVDGQIWLDTDASVPSTTVTRWYKLPSAGTTTLSGNDDNSIPLAYTPGYEQVFLNGTLLSRSAADYTATTGTSVVLSSAIVAGDIVEIICPLQITTTDTYTQSAADNKFVQNTGYFAAGKNKIINGDFAINQRGFSSVTNPNTAPYTFDRWIAYAGTTGSSNAVFSNQSFTIGTAPVSGYESTNFLRIVTTSQDATNSIVFPQQRIEDVRSFAGQTVTISFWAKANSGTPKVFIEMSQAFGSGGSPSSGVNTNCGQVTLSTSWARYSVTVSIPSIAGKTIGTTAGTSYVSFQPWISAGTTFNSRTGSLGAQNNTFDFWGFQIESGSIATNFTTATGTLQGELAACQRYYWRNSADTVYAYMGCAVNAWSTTEADLTIQNPVPMRVPPTSVEYSTLILSTRAAGTTYAVTSASLASTAQSRMMSQIRFSVASGLTAAVRYDLLANNSTNAYLAINAEL
jgi:hypothetical protein